MNTMATGASKTILLGADHTGVGIKSKIKAMLSASGCHCVDLGAFAAEPCVDYADYARQLGTMVQHGEGTAGILICGTGAGMCTVVNACAGVRGAVVRTLPRGQWSREQAAANVLCLSAWATDDETNLQIADAWCNARCGEPQAGARVAKSAPAGKAEIIFTNGVFDILHAGHIEVLKFAKSLGGKLVVGLNSDRSVKELKGPQRPINAEQDRRTVLQAIKYVDQVIVFDTLRPTALIQLVQPRIVVKGGELTPEELRRRDGIPDHIDVQLCPFVRGYSSTRIINQIRN